MASLSDFAKAYEPPTTKNIADLKEVSVELQIEARTGKDENNEEYAYNVVVIDKIEYRVPNSVLTGLKSILEKKPTLKKFSVSKQGTGLNTKYQVIPLE